MLVPHTPLSNSTIHSVTGYAPNAVPEAAFGKKSTHGKHLPRYINFYISSDKMRKSVFVGAFHLRKKAQLLLHMTKSMCIVVQLRKFFFHNSQLHNERLLDKSQNP